MSSITRDVPERLEESRLDGEYSLTVSRALQLLSAFTSEQPERGVSDLSRALRLSKSSTHRLVHALERHRFLHHDPVTRKYRIGVEAFRVGNLFSEGRRLEREALPLMRTLVASTGFTSYLTHLMQDAMIIVASVEATGPIRYTIPVGTPLPIHGTATGKAALSGLPDKEVAELLDRLKFQRFTARTITDARLLRKELASIRSNGYSMNWEERTPGVGSVAAPLMDTDGSLLAVVSLGFATSQIEKRQLPRLGRELKDTAAEIVRRMHGGATSITRKKETA